jgi:hypothetical protein
MKLTKGVPNTTTLKFKNSPSFAFTPNFEVSDNNGNVLAAGTAVIGSGAGEWSATFTIPNSYITLSGFENITVEIYGKDSSNKIRSTEQQFELLDSADDFENFGSIYTNFAPVEDSFVAQKAYTTSQISAYISDNAGNIITGPLNPTFSEYFRAMNKTDVADRFTDPSFSGYKYSITLPNFVLPSPYYDHFSIRYVLTTGSKPEQIIRPLYPVTGLIVNQLINLKMYLDKARLKEIDQSLQWHDDELVHALFEGAKYINNYPATPTYWTIDQWPQIMGSMLFVASAMWALNSRYLAEGFNTFQFQGLSTSLDFDRKEAITYKIEELKGILDNQLEKSKAGAVRVIGAGTPQPTIVVSSTSNNIALSGITINATNRRGRIPYGLGGRRYGW